MEFNFGSVVEDIQSEKTKNPTEYKPLVKGWLPVRVATGYKHHPLTLTVKRYTPNSGKNKGVVQHQLLVRGNVWSLPGIGAKYKGQKDRDVSVRLWHRQWRLVLLTVGDFDKLSGVQAPYLRALAYVWQAVDAALKDEAGTFANAELNGASSWKGLEEGTRTLRDLNDQCHAATYGEPAPEPEPEPEMVEEELVLR